MSIELPPTPASVEDAVRLSNLYAYNGQPKNTLDYWGSKYANDPLYFWRRMLGWQAEDGPDQALSGLYAVPPSPWFQEAPEAPPVENPQNPPPEPPFTPIDLQAVHEKLDAIIQTLANVATKDDLRSIRNELITAAKSYGGLLNLFHR